MAGWMLSCFQGHVQMLLKSILAGTTNWLRGHRYEMIDHRGPAVDEDGLLVDELEEGDSISCGTDVLRQRTSPVQTMTAMDRRDSVEKMQDGFNRLVDQLAQINGHFGRQLDQHEELMSRVRQLPQLLESFPQMVDNQRQLHADLCRQMEVVAQRHEQFLNAVGQIPTETARQTRTLGDIHHQLEVAAQTDADLATCFNGVGDAIKRLDASTADNTAGMLRIQKSAAARERYLAHALSSFQRRIVWLFVGFSVLGIVAISILIGLIIHLRS
jgi:hypothetical protein